MAKKGVTQEQVNDAADALVVAGERPTVERIRAFLGSGSPNTVTRLLDGWWRELGTRLTAQQAKLALPDAPPTVATLASQFWEQALDLAQEHAIARLANERTALDLAHAALEEREAAWQLQLSDQARLAQEAQRLLHVAEQRLEDLQQVSQQQVERLSDFSKQRVDMQSRIDRLESELAALHARGQQRETEVTDERQRQAEHIRAVEDRAHREVDRARQEAQGLTQQLRQLQYERRDGELDLRRQLDARQAALVDAQQEAHVQRARADTLDTQLARLSALPATPNEAQAPAGTMRRGRTAASRRKPGPRPGRKT